MRSLAAAALIIALALAGLAAAQTRHFAIQGSNPWGSTYGGSLMLQQDGAADPALSTPWTDVPPGRRLSAGTECGSRR